MSNLIPTWQPGTTYTPGALVIPSSGSITVADQPQNPGFETGDLTGWTDTSGLCSVITYQPYAGSYCANATGNGVGQLTNNTTFPVNTGDSVTAKAMIRLTNAGTDDTSGQANIVWYDVNGDVISTSHGSEVSGSGGYWRASSISAKAPSGANSFSVAVGFNTGQHGGSVAMDAVTLSYAYSGLPTGLAYQAVQSNPGKSGTTEPAWPGVLGETVIDNQVTWEAVIGSMIVWQASPIMESGDTEPVWATSPGATVHDGTIDWVASTAQITDANCPQTPIVQIAAGKIYAADNDIVRYCATVNPLDWTSDNDAGYLPYGLQTYGSNPAAAMGLYRSNLCIFNAEGFQMWQVDPDPENINLLDALPIASTQNQALSPVANDLIFLSSRGVRSVGVAAASTQLEAGDVGMPIDPLIQASMKAALANGTNIRSAFIPSLGQYWLAFSSPAPAPDLPWQDVVTAYDAAVAGGATDPISAATAMLAAAPPNMGGPLARAQIIVGDAEWSYPLHGAFPVSEQFIPTNPNFGTLAFQTAAIILMFCKQGVDGGAIANNQVWLYLIGGPAESVDITAYDASGNQIGTTTMPYYATSGDLAIYLIQATDESPNIPPSILDNMTTGQTYTLEVSSS